MNFGNIKAIHIPEGYVKEIKCTDKVLWEKPLICNPRLEAEFKLNWQLPFTVYIYELSESLFQYLNVSLQEYDDITGDYTIILYKVENVGITNIRKDLDALECDDIINHGDSGGAPNYNTRNCRYLIELVYTDLDGNTQTLVKTVRYESSLFGL